MTTGGSLKRITEPLYVIFYGDFERPLRRRFREVFAKFSRSFSEKTAPKKFLEMIVFIAAIDFVKFSSKSELSSRFFGRLNFSAVLGALMGR